MKKILSISALCFLTIINAQVSGDLISVEKKMDLTDVTLAQAFTPNSELTGDSFPTEITSTVAQNAKGLQAYKIVYWTKNYIGKLVKASGLVTLPRVNYQLSTVVHLHGTTINRDAVPSNFTKNPFLIVDLYYASNGYIVISPDYLGMGEGEKYHLFVNDKTQTSSSYDLVIATNKFLSTLGIKRYNEYFITGYSQGGHAAMGFAKFNATKNTTPLNIKYLYPGSGPYDLSDTTLNKSFFEKDIFPIASILPIILNSCHQMGYKQYENDPAEILTAEYVEDYKKHILSGNYNILWGGSNWRKLMRPEAISAVQNNMNHPLRNCLRESDNYRWYNKYPTTLSTASLDLFIPPQNATKAQDVQRSYYPWWDLSKYQVNAEVGLPYGHAGAFIPWLVNSTYTFNTKRSGGFFNVIAMAQATSNTNQKTVNPITESKLTSSVHPKTLLQEMGFEKVNILDISNKNIQTASTLEHLKEGSYLLTAISDKGEKTFIPYQKQSPINLPFDEVFKNSTSEHFVGNLSSIPDLKNVFIWDENKTLVKSYSNSDILNGNLVITKNELQHGNYQVEIISGMGRNLMVALENKAIAILESTKVYSENQIIKVVSSQTITSVEIYDMSGKILASQKISAKNYTSSTIYNKGIYIVKIQYQNGNKEQVKVILK